MGKEISKKSYGESAKPGCRAHQVGPTAETSCNVLVKNKGSHVICFTFK